nr:hypothetical protein [Nonomuraea polychroma]
MEAGPAEDVAAHACRVDLFVQALDDRIQVSRVAAGLLGFVTVGLDVGAELDQPALFLVRLVGDDRWFLVEVPAFAALGLAQLLVALSARRALAVHRRAAGNIDDLPLAGVGVEPFERDGPDAHAVELATCHATAQM